MNDTPSEQPSDNFASYLMQTLLGNPRTQAQIGSVVRGVLIAVGSTWASTHGDAINMIAGIVVAVAAAIWGIYQKWRVDRKIQTLKAAAIPAVPEVPK
jgi:hypothetical protein